MGRARLLSMLRRRPAAFAVGAAVTLAIGAGLVSKHWDRELTDAEWVACSSQIVEGTLVNVQSTNIRAFDSVVVATDTWVKPADGPARLRLLTESAEAAGRTLQRGDQVFVVVPDRGNTVADVFPARLSGADGAEAARERVEAHLAGSSDIACPLWWLQESDPRFDTPDDA